ncbi:MarR family protein [Candidatus Desulfosporosinus infrequens]|uniref:MarR family protein n=1 Tax=Candidatus Desulfosporosinus infrequens TaxID=2043169 RepID=A0A2U3KG38_9FIRM|nr:MarR family protein [Candidatus Desulfosporosinus infrequens]
MDYNDHHVKQAAALVQSFVTITRTLTKFTKQNATSLGLTIQQMGILNTIYSSPDITLKEITEKLQLLKSTVSISVEDLVHLDLVERKTSEEDRRAIRLKLTPAGQELSKKSCQNALSYRAMSLALENLPDEDIQFLVRIHNELLNNLQNCKF